MNTKKIFRIFAACLAFTVVSSAYADGCTPALVVVRHAEDTQQGFHELTAKDGAWGGGKAHAAAYQAYLPGLLQNLGYCDLAHFVSSDKGSMNPYNTVLPTAQFYGHEVHSFDDNNTSLTPNYNWSNPSFLSSLINPDESTFMALSKEAMWGDKDWMDKNRALASFVNGDKNRNYIRDTGEPLYNRVYVFTEQDPVNKKFNKVRMYLQLYSPKYKSQDVNRCDYRLKDYVTKVKITDLEILMPSPNDNYTDFVSRFGCTYRGN